MEKKADIGLIGLAVMGQNLALNICDHGYPIAVFNRTTTTLKKFLATTGEKKEKLLGAETLKEFFSLLRTPKKVIFMVKAGEAVDQMIEQCLPYMESGDILIDGGNSFFKESERRYEKLQKLGIRFLGVGISGGESGARFGPSIMPGGDIEAWKEVRNIFEDISAKVDSQEPCCHWMGTGGAGHYVKMVHNGIEYGDMQMICEIFDLLRRIYRLSDVQIAEIFAQWNETELESYLIEITEKICTFSAKKESGLLDRILDVAGQKGTGKWMALNSMELNSPTTLVKEAICARFLSAMKEERQKASTLFPFSEKNALSLSGDSEEFRTAIKNMGNALYAAKIVSYAQGFSLMKSASDSYGWNLDYGNIALTWRGGCIIRSKFLHYIKEAFEKNGELSHLLLDSFFAEEILRSEKGWRTTIAQAVLHGIPTPCLSAALAFFDGYRSARLPTNLLQAQRDFFGAHTYERTDSPRGKFFHTEWK